MSIKEKNWYFLYDLHRRSCLEHEESVKKEYIQKILHPWYTPDYFKIGLSETDFEEKLSSLAQEKNQLNYPSVIEMLLDEDYFTGHFNNNISVSDFYENYKNKNHFYFEAHKQFFARVPNQSFGLPDNQPALSHHIADNKFKNAAYFGTGIIPRVSLLFVRYFINIFMRDDLNIVRTIKFFQSSFKKQLDIVTDADMIEYLTKNIRCLADLTPAYRLAFIRHMNDQSFNYIDIDVAVSEIAKSFYNNPDILVSLQNFIGTYPQFENLVTISLLAKFSSILKPFLLSKVLIALNSTRVGSLTPSLLVSKINTKVMDVINSRSRYTRFINTVTNPTVYRRGYSVITNRKVVIGTTTLGSTLLGGYYYYKNRVPIPTQALSPLVTTAIAHLSVFKQNAVELVYSISGTAAAIITAARRGFLDQILHGVMDTFGDVYGRYKKITGS